MRKTTRMRYIMKDALFRCQLHCYSFTMKFICTFVFVLVCLYVVKAQEDCSKLGIHFYEDIGCPKKENGTECPSFEDCKYERPQGGCLYRGQKLRSGQAQPDDPSCYFGCFCSVSELDNKGTFVCAEGSCRSWGLPLSPSCYYKFNLDQCCPEGSDCEIAQPIPTCTVDGKVYREGEIYTPKGTCLNCRCNGGDGQYKASECVKKACDLEIRETENLEKNCAPVYYQENGETTLCCPHTTICPSNDDVVIQDKPIPGGKTCKYGDQVFKQGRKIQRIVHQYGTNRTATCECLSPPWLTCSAEY